MGTDGVFFEPLSHSCHSSLADIDPGDYGRRRTDYCLLSTQLPMLYVPYFFLGVIYSC